MAIVSAGCTVAPIRAYEGETLPREETAILRAVGPGRFALNVPGYMLLEVELDNPVDGEPVESRFISPLDKSPWIAISAGYQCFLVRSRPMRCPSFLEEIVGIGSPDVQCQSVSANLWAEQEVCFEVNGRSEYEIQLDATRSDDCIGGLEVTEFRVTERRTGDLVEAYEHIAECGPTGGSSSP